MINSYIILNRKPKTVIILFVHIILFLLILAIWGINTLYYQSFFHIHSKILYQNSYYYLEVLIPAKEVETIATNQILIIESKSYNYHVYKTEPNIIYQNNQNYQKMYLVVTNLEKKYQVNGYQIDVKIKKEKKKIIEYLKE